jgi:outer membrane protein
VIKNRVIPLLLLVSLLSGAVLTLEDAQKSAMENGFDVRIDSLDNEARQWQKRNVVSGYLPQVNYNATVMRYDDLTVEQANGSSGLLAGLGYPVDESLQMRKNGLSHEFAFSQPITNGGAEVVAIKMAKHTKLAQEEGYEANRTALLLQVNQRYFELIKANKQIDIATQDLGWAKRNLENAESRFTSGILPETDLLRWKREEIEKRAFLLQTEMLVDYQTAELRVALGQDPTVETVIETEVFENFEVQFNEISMESGLVDSSSMLKSLDGYREISEYNRKLAVTSAMPRLNAFASYTKDQKWDGGDEFYTADGVWAGGVALNVPLFSGFRTSTNYFEKKYDARKADVNFEKTKSVMQANLIRIKKQIEATRVGALSASEQFDLNIKNFEIMNDRYSAGQIAQIDLLEMNRAVAASRLDYISKLLETLYHVAEYNNAIGKLEVPR